MNNYSIIYFRKEMNNPRKHCSFCANAFIHFVQSNSVHSENTFFDFALRLYFVKFRVFMFVSIIEQRIPAL